MVVVVAGVVGRKLQVLDRKGEDVEAVAVGDDVDTAKSVGFVVIIFFISFYVRLDQ